MVKVICIILYRYNGIDNAPTRLCHCTDMTNFGYFSRGTVREHVLFASRIVVQRTPQGSRQTVAADNENPFLVHAYVRLDGLSGAVVSDKEYPQRVAFALLQKSMRDYESNHPKNDWEEQKIDSDEEPENMLKDITAFQNPHEADKLTAIQKQLDEVKDIMQKNIEDVLARGETLDTLMAKSEDLSSSSVQFYKQAKKVNSCCKYY